MADSATLERDGATTIAEAGTKLTDLPAGPINHHWTKNVFASRDSSKLYATVGSNSNVAENGLDKEENRAAILEIDRADGNRRVFASDARGCYRPDHLQDRRRSPITIPVDSECDY
jgi:glucose/arabinose dehydrogenase